jgi:hypothetical protein
MAHLLPRSLICALVAAGAPGLARAEGRNGIDLAAGYAFLQTPEYSGLAADFSWQSARGVGVTVDVGGHFGEGDSLFLFAAGPRLSRQLKPGLKLSGRLLAGLVTFDGGGGGALVAYPGVAVDFGTDRPLGFRLQGDWPLLTLHGVYPQIPRVSASLVFRPGRRP